MTAILTGDIIDSRLVKPQEWLPVLEKSLALLATDRRAWEVFRGDSFQLEVPVDQAIKAALYLKCTVKQVKGIDVRISIGVGEKNYADAKLSQSNGSAFIHSGEAFDRLKNRTLGFQSDNEAWNEVINLFLDLISTIVDAWTPVSILLIQKMFENPQLTQLQLAELTRGNQGNISKALKRGGYEEIQKVLQYYVKNNPYG
ncbi:transcriptional regulator [Flavobacterium sp. JP2137]|uniref:transcriptional regulator n=1 Tax=Flavobacterium sp. JP2137 TaxID=3414510 RepID=UPI003D3011BC